MEALESELRRALEGEFRCVLLEGDPGMGKTRLAREFLDRTAGRALTLSARGYPLGATASFRLWAELFEGHLRALPAEEVQKLCGGYLEDLGEVLRSAAAARGSGEGREPSAVRLLEGLAVLLRNLSRRRATVVLLDDLHLADPSSCEALDYLAHNLVRDPVLILAGARPGELDRLGAAKQVLFRLEQDGILRRVALSPLEAADIGELAGAVLGTRAAPQGLVTWLLERSRGNALFAVGLLDALLEEGADLSDPRLESLPESLSDRVLATVEALDRAAVETLELLAVVGRRADLRDVERLSARPQYRVADGLQALVEAGLVAEHEEGSQLEYEISHPLVQEATYGRIGGARRRSLHRTIGHALLAADRADEAAPHFARSAAIGDEEGISALRRAARQAWSRSAFREAFEVIGSLLELIPSGDERWRDVLELMSPEGEWVFHHRVDLDPEIAVKVMREIDRIVDAGSEPRHLAALNLHFAGFLAWGSGDLEDAERRARAAVELFAKAGDDSHARIAANELAWIEGLQGDFDSQDREAGRVLAGAQAAGDRAATLMALANLGASALARGRFDEAEALIRRSIDTARAEDNAARLRYGLDMLALCLAFDGRLEEARQSLAEARGAAPPGGDVLLREVAPYMTWFSGDFARTMAEAREAAARSRGRPSGATFVGVLAAVETGSVSDARSLLDDAAHAAATRRFWFMGQSYDWARGMVSWREGDAAGALEILDKAASALIDAEALPVGAHVLADLAELAADTGSREAAEGAAEQLDQISRRLDRDHYRALAGLGAAWSMLSSGAHKAAAERAQEAANLLAGGRYKALEARVLALLGRALSRSDRRRAVEALRSAVALLDACAAHWRRERAVEALQGLGKPGRRAAAAASGPDSVTRREREVVDLALEGLTAREIGERLYISDRTVETHLANAYAKLGVGSRLELMRRMSELER